MPLNVFKTFNAKCNIKKYNIVLEAFGGSRINPVGFVLNCLVDGIEHELNF